jgi:hypothetical protein
MAAKLIRLTHKIAIQVHLVAESSTVCSSRFRRPFRKLLDTPSYVEVIDDHRYCDMSAVFHLLLSTFVSSVLRCLLFYLGTG